MIFMNIWKNFKNSIQNVKYYYAYVYVLEKILTVHTTKKTVIVLRLKLAYQLFLIKLPFSIQNS